MSDLLQSAAEVLQSSDGHAPAPTASSPQRRLSTNPADSAAFSPTTTMLPLLSAQSGDTAMATSRRAPRPMSAALPPRLPHVLTTPSNPSAGEETTRPMTAMGTLPTTSKEGPTTTPTAAPAPVHTLNAESMLEVDDGDADVDVAVDAEPTPTYPVEKRSAVVTPAAPFTQKVAASPPHTQDDGDAFLSANDPAPPSHCPTRTSSSDANARNTLLIPIPDTLAGVPPPTSQAPRRVGEVEDAAGWERERDGVDGMASAAVSSTSTTTSTATRIVEPIDNKSRFRYLFLGLLVMFMSSAMGTFAIFGFYIQKAYAYVPEDMINLFVIGTACGLAATFLSGILYDLYAQRFMVLITGVLMVVPACLLIGLTFHGSISGTKAQFIGFFFLLNVGTYGLDLTALMTTVTHFPRNRGMVCGLLKTFSGLGASFFSCLYRGYLYNKTPSKNFSNLFFFMTALVFAFGVLCTIFFKPAPWADIRFYRYARRRRAQRFVCARLSCLHRFQLGGAAKTWHDGDAGTTPMTPAEVETYLREYFVAKVPYLKYRPPQRRIRITFALLMLINVYMTLQVILVAYLEVTSRSALNGIATGALILVLLTSILAWPLDCLDNEVDYAAAEQDFNEDGVPIGPAVVGGEVEDGAHGDGERRATADTALGTSPLPPLALKPASIANPLTFPGQSAAGDDSDKTGADAALVVGTVDRAAQLELQDERAFPPSPVRFAGQASAATSRPVSRRASTDLSFYSSAPASRVRRGSAPRRTSKTPVVENVITNNNNNNSSSAFAGASAVPVRTHHATPMASHTRRQVSALAETPTLSALLFARDVSEAALMMEDVSSASHTPLEESLVGLSAVSRRSTTTSAQQPQQLQQPSGAPPALRGELEQSTSVRLSPSRRATNGEVDANAAGRLLSASVSFAPETEGDGEGTGLLHQTQRECADVLMQSVVLDSAAQRRIPVNGDTVIELLKHRDGFWRALLTPELWVLLWISFTVWATGITITSNLFIQLFYAAADGKAMPNNLYYLFASLSGISIAGGRVVIGTVADDLLPALRRKFHRPFGLSFTMLLVFPPWATVLGLVFFMAIPQATVQILGHMCLGFAYGLTTSAVPYAITVFFSFEYVGLGKMYGLCLLAAGAGVAVLYRATFAELYLKEAYPVGQPAIPQAAWGMCLSSKKTCTLSFFVVCLVLNVVAGLAGIYLHIRFETRLKRAAREQIARVEPHVATADVDVAYLHDWVYAETAPPAKTMPATATAELGTPATAKTSSGSE